MSLKKRLVAACAAVIMACSLAGCGNKTGYIMKTDGEEMASGVYLSLMLTEYTNQLYSLYYSGGEVADTFEKQKIGDQLMSEYLEDYAYNTCIEIFAVEKKCEELGIKLSDEEKKEVNDAVNSAWDTNGEYYEEMGISKESLKRVQSYSYLSAKLFEGLYYEGGVEEVKMDEISTYVKDNLLRYKMIYIAIEEDDADSAKKMSEKYMGYAEEGKTMDELIEMYEDETSDDKDEATDGEDEATDDKDEATDSEDEATDDKDEATDDKDEATDSEDEATDGEDEATDSEDEATDGEDEATDSEDEATDGEGEATDSEDEATDSEDDEEEKTPAQIESEKYPNEYVRDKTGFDDDKFIDFIAGLEYGKISSYSDDDGYYIVERLDMSERTEFAEANKESLISTMRSEAFETLLKSLCDGVEIKKNEKSFEKYKAVDVIERQNDWYEKNAE